MSNCIITLKVGGESINVSVDSSSLPNNYVELKNILLKQDKWESLINNIKGSLKARKVIKDIKLEDMINSSHLISNCRVSNLRARFPSVEFPGDTPEYNISSKKILFVNKYQTKRGNLLYGRIINKNGEEIFIVDSQHVQQLANFFKLLQSIISSNVVNLLEKNYLDLLELIYKEAIKNNYLKLEISNYIKTNLSREKDSVTLLKEALLFIFALTKTPFREIIYNYNEKSLSAYVLLEQLGGELLDLPTTNRNYLNKDVEILANSISDYTSDFKQATLSKNVLYKILPLNIKENAIKLELIKKDGTISIDKLNKILNQSIKDDRETFESLFGKSIIDKYSEEYSGWGILVQEILNKDRSFNFLYKEINKGNIILEKFSSNLESVYDIGFEELLELNEPTYYNGKYILEKPNKDGSKEYYVTDYYTTEFLKAEKFKTLELALNYINKDKKIIQNSLKFLHTLDLREDGTLVSNNSNNLVVQTDHFIPPKSLITVIDYDVPSLDLDTVPEEMKGFLSSNLEVKTMEDFKSFVENQLNKYLKEEFYTSIDKEKILNVINTPEKVFLFVSLLNNPNFLPLKKKVDISNKEEVLAVVDDIVQHLNNFRYYYVKDYYSKSRNVVLIPYKPKLINEYRKDRKYPIKNIWKAALEVLAPKLGIGVSLQLLSNEEIQNKLGDSYDFNAKAFIKDNTIYINSDLALPEDFFHEYVHIVLGMLKTNESTRDAYKKLLEEVWNYEKDEDLKGRVLDTYKDYSFLDLMEEYFAIKFGNWIKNNTKVDYSNIFENSILTLGTYLLFNLDNQDKKLKSFYGKTLPEVFLNFNSEIGLYLKEHPTLAGGEFSKLFSLSRKKSEWIRLLIHDGKLNEYDCI